MSAGRIEDDNRDQNEEDVEDPVENDETFEGHDGRVFVYAVQVGTEGFNRSENVPTEIDSTQEEPEIFQLV